MTSASSASGALSPDALSAGRSAEAAERLVRALAPASGRSQDDELLMLVPAALRRFVARRAALRRLRVKMRVVARSPLLRTGSLGAEESVEMFLFQVRPPSADSFLSSAFARAISDLPGVVVARPTIDDSLWVDIRRRLSSARFSASGASSESENDGTKIVPPGEIWLLGAEDVGQARLKSRGEWREIELDLSASNEDFAWIPQTRAAAAPSPEPVRLVRRAVAERDCEAVLLDETELDRLRRWLRTRPLGDDASLLLGPGACLLSASPEALRAIPFGAPLRRSRAGLFIEQGVEVVPPLSTEALRRVFELRDDEVVVLTELRALRFSLADLHPAWILWAGRGPQVEAGLSPSLARWAKGLGDLAAPLESAVDVVAPGGADGEVDSELRSDLLRRARYAELAGDLFTAAEMLEQAGEMLAAGRLWERAARDSS